MFSFQNAWPIKRKAVYTLVLFHMQCIHSFPCENQIRSQLVYFLKQLGVFKFRKPSSDCRRQEVLLQVVNFTGYPLVRRTLL